MGSSNDKVPGVNGSGLTGAVNGKSLDAANAKAIADAFASFGEQPPPAGHGPICLRLRSPTDFLDKLLAEALAEKNRSPEGAVVTINILPAIKAYMDTLYAEFEMATAERDMLRANLQTAEAAFTELRGKLIRLRAITEPAGAN